MALVIGNGDYIQDEAAAVPRKRSGRQSRTGRGMRADCRCDSAHPRRCKDTPTSRAMANDAGTTGGGQGPKIPLFIRRFQGVHLMREA